jgi:alpha-1,2-mannosyltransferase
MAWWLHWFDLVDLAVYRAGASAFLHGRDVYSARPKVLPLPFTYPPFAAMAFVPLSAVPDIAARIVMSLLSGAAVTYAVVATLRLAVPRWPRRAQWTVALFVAAATPLVEPFRDTFRLGQVNLVLMALVLADLVAITGAPAGESDAGARRGGRLPRGVLIGLATAVKLTPGIFILYLLVIRRTKEAITAALTAAGATALAWIAMPAESAHYWGHLVLDDRRIGSAGNVWNQSIRGALARASGSPDKAHLLWLLLALVALVAGMALAARLHAAGEPLLGIGVAAVTGLLVSPISWNHHWVWALPLGVGLWRRALVTRKGPAPADRWLAAGWTATFCLGSLSWWHFATQDNYRLGGIDTIAADCYVLAAIVALALVGWTIGRVSPAAK